MPLMMPSQAGGLTAALAPQGQGLLARLLGGGAPQSMGSGLGQRLSDLLNPSVALPMAGAMMAGRTPQAGFGDAMTLGGLGLGKLNETRKAEAEKNKTMAFLRASHPELADMVAAGMPIKDAWDAVNGGKDSWINAGDGNLYNPNTGEWKRPPAGPGGGAFTGNSLDAQAYRKLIADGMSEHDAANWAVSKTITDPSDNSIRLVTPEDVLGGAIQPGGGNAPSATGAPLISPTPGAPGGVGTRITPPKPIRETETQRNKKFAIDQSSKSLDAALTKWEALVTKSGMSVVPGQEQDDLKTTRQGIMLELKELAELGVLNGPDLSLMQRMIVDPVIDPGMDSTWDMASKGITGGLGNLGIGEDITSRAKNNVKTLRAMIKQKRDAAFAATDGVTTGGAPVGGADPLGIRGNP